jgi:hypothetical protein
MNTPSKPSSFFVVAVQVDVALSWRDTARHIDDQVRGNKTICRVFVSINPGNSIVHWIELLTNITML